MEGAASKLALSKLLGVSPMRAAQMCLTPHTTTPHDGGAGGEGGSPCAAEHTHSTTPTLT